MRGKRSPSSCKEKTVKVIEDIERENAGCEVPRDTSEPNVLALTHYARSH